ncbi:MAG TPA: MoaD/ThiS family protein [Gemmataceae bacterium]|jgi:molybdopterin converting factor subunit 1|nr:MoaD/ThiS family protein [Gemmataceae bacterium]
MMIEVQLFARARDLAGRDMVAVELPAGATVADLRAAIRAACPALEGLLARSRLAVGNDFVSEETRLTAGASVALIPPVSGG